MRILERIKKSSKSEPLYIAAFWGLILLANFVPVIPQPSTIIGYLWKVEFIFAIFLAVSLFLGIKFLKNEKTLFDFSRQEVFLLILPVIIFTIWSGFSALWANTPRNATHHTLLWSCYGIFYILARIIVRNARLLDVSFKVTGVVIAVLGFACLTEYFSSEITQLFTYRYYKYAEALSVLLPVFVALALRKNSRAAVFSAIIAAVCWTVVVISLSRMIFLAAFAGIGVFFTLIFISFGKKYLEKNPIKSAFDFSMKKAFLFIGFLSFITILSQISFSGAADEDTTIKRFTSESHGNYTLQSRYLDWAIGLEMFKMNPAVGIGADNFVTSYRTAHENFSQTNPHSELVKLDETILPERAHNEYLQIIAELGVIGGLIFIWFLFGIGSLLFEIFRQKKVPMLSIGAFAGMTAFLVSSLASSYSFRVPANGICFFFVLALAAENLLKNKEKFSLDFAKFRFAFVYAGLAICLSMIIFSGVRGASLMYLQMSADDQASEEKYLQIARALDENDALINYCYGYWLHKNNRHDEAAEKFRRAIDNGLATSISYHDLYTAQISARRDAEGEKTLEEALRVFPKSVFLLTAHAAHLQKTDDLIKSELQLAKASEIDRKQAESWWIVMNEGTTKLNNDREENENLVEVMKLQPAGAIFSVLDFQRRNNPKLVMR